MNATQRRCCESRSPAADAGRLDERDCPVCRSPNRQVPLAVEGPFELARCAECAMLYTHRVLSVAAKVERYAAMANERRDTTARLAPAHHSLANQIRAVALYETVLRDLLREFPAGNVRLVDIGCAGGLFLLAAQVAEDSYNCGRPPRFEVRGVSIDSRERQETARVVGCPVANLTQAAAAWPRWADAATATNVLEHVNDPPAFLADVRQILRPGGLLVIDVPNNAVRAAKATLTKRWGQLDLGEHINHFVPATLDNLLRRAGFTHLRRLPGLLHGVDSFATPHSSAWLARWLIARAAFALTRGGVQLFPQMTAVYRSDRRSCDGDLQLEPGRREEDER